MTERRKHQSHCNVSGHVPGCSYRADLDEMLWQELDKLRQANISLTLEKDEAVEEAIAYRISMQQFIEAWNKTLENLRKENADMYNMLINLSAYCTSEEDYPHWELKRRIDKLLEELHK